MVAEVLTPGVENGSNSKGSLQVIATEFQQGRCGTGEHEGVEARLVVSDEQV